MRFDFSHRIALDGPYGNAEFPAGGQNLLLTPQGLGVIYTELSLAKLRVKWPDCLGLRQRTVRNRRVRPRREAAPAERTTPFASGAMFFTQRGKRAGGIPSQPIDLVPELQSIPD